MSPCPPRLPQYFRVYTNWDDSKRAPLKSLVPVSVLALIEAEEKNKEEDGRGEQGNTGDVETGEVAPPPAAAANDGVAGELDAASGGRKDQVAPATQL